MGLPLAETIEYDRFAVDFVSWVIRLRAAAWRMGDHGRYDGGRRESVRALAL
ncbi:MAG: hypothetical protein OER43_03285 [Gammaproteobacteria bacterium]|nr:hypothetical protein [Gammaproteobacteria bacterium]